MDRSELGRQLAALQRVVEKVCEAAECGKVYATTKPNRSRWCSPRCRFRHRAKRRAAPEPAGGEG